MRTVGRPSKKIMKNSCYDKETASSQFVKPVTQVTQVAPSAPTTVATTDTATDADATTIKAAANNTVATAALITKGQNGKSYTGKKRGLKAYIVVSNEEDE